MPRVQLTKLIVKNFGPIVDDEITLGDFSYFVGRNNAGKSHYLSAIELLLAPKAPTKDEILKHHRDKTKPIYIEGHFTGVKDFIGLLKASNHKQVVEGSLTDGVLRVARILNAANEDEPVQQGIPAGDGSIQNPTGFFTNLLKILPETISIVATADTIEELSSRGATAINKLKKEVMASFFVELKTKTQEALSSLDEFLNSPNTELRSRHLADFEQQFREEMSGEFQDVRPSVGFALPDEEVIAKEMTIYLDDGHKSEIEQKGHGLQRAALLAMLRLLAKHGQRYQDRPTPIFLIGEIETFLHPYAQTKLAQALDSLKDRYQIITSTHSPFIIRPENIRGYFRVLKKLSGGTKAIPSRIDGDSEATVERHLERRGNLEALFADRVILVEGVHDEGFYERAAGLLGIARRPGAFLKFVKTCGKTELRLAREFYVQMAFEDVSVICDLDYVFSSDFQYLLKEMGMDPQTAGKFRAHINWSTPKDPSLENVLEGIAKNGYPSEFDKILQELRQRRFFVLKRGAMEHYHTLGQGGKGNWEAIESANQLIEPGWIKDLLSSVLGQDVTPN